MASGRLKRTCGTRIFTTLFGYLLLDRESPRQRASLVPLNLDAEHTLPILRASERTEYGIVSSVFVFDTLINEPFCFPRQLLNVSGKCCGKAVILLKLVFIFQVIAILIPFNFHFFTPFAAILS
jgi:hypothetical protein